MLMAQVVFLLVTICNKGSSSRCMLDDSSFICTFYRALYCRIKLLNVRFPCNKKCDDQSTWSPVPQVISVTVWTDTTHTEAQLVCTIWVCLWVCCSPLLPYWKQSVNRYSNFTFLFSITEDHVCLTLPLPPFPLSARDHMSILISNGL